MADFNAELGQIPARRLEPDLPPAIDFNSLLEGAAENRAETEEFAAVFAGQSQLVPGGMGGDIPSVVARLGISAADTLAEKITAFKGVFPEGELVSVPVDDTLIFRRSPSESFQKVDADLLEEFEPLGDLIDFFGSDIGAITGEALSLIPGGKAATTGAKQGFRVLPLMARLAAGGGFGEFSQEAVESAAGFQQENVGTVAARATLKSAFSAGGGVVGKGLEKLVSGATGRGLLEITKEGQRAQRATKVQGVDDLPANIISSNPLVQKLGGQSAALVPTLGDYITQLEGQVTRALGRLRGPTGRLPQDLKAAHDLERKSVLRETLESTKQTSQAKGGASIQEGITRYDESSAAQVTASYTRARQIEEPQFDFVPLLNEAEDIELGVRGLGTARTRDVDTGILDIRGDPITRKVTDQELVKLDEVNTTTRLVIDKIKALDPSLPPVTLPNGRVVSSTEQLRALRTRLFDVMIPPPGDIVRAEHVTARRLFGSIGKMMNDPINNSRGFIDAWKTANGLAKDRFDTREKLLLIRTAKSEEPANLVSRIAAPGNEDNLQLLRRVLPLDKFDDLQNAFKSDLLDPNKVDNLSQRLNSFDKGTLDQLLSPGERAVFGKIGQELDRLNSVGVKKVLERQTRASFIADNLVRTDNTAGIDRLLRVVANTGGKDSPLGQTMRASIIDNIFFKSTVRERGVLRVDFNRLNAEINRLTRTGGIKFLKVDDLRVIRDVRDIQDFLRLTPDSGTSIQASEQVAGTKKLKGSAFLSLLRNATVGRFMVNPAGRKFLAGTGKGPQFDFKSAKLLAAALATTQVPTEAEIERQVKTLERTIEDIPGLELKIGK